MKKAAKLTTSIIMLILLSFGLFPIQAFAWVTGEGLSQKSFQVGVYVDLKIGTDQARYLPVELASGSFPAGIQFIQVSGSYGENYRIRGTALPGTVGDYAVSFRDGENLPGGQRLTYTVNKGPQTTVCDNAAVRIGGTVILSPYSKNGNGDVISTGSIDAPTYTFVSSDPGVASVNPTTGVVTPISVGTATITISSAENGSYLAAANVTVQVEVLPVEVLPSPASVEVREDRSTPAVGYEKAIIGHCKEWVNVRSGPGTNFGIIGRAYLGENIELLQWDKGEVWCKVIYNGGENAGWVHGKFIIPQKK